MEAEMQKSIYTGLSVVMAVALIVVSMAMVKVCYIGYNDLIFRRALSIQNAEKAKFAPFEGELSTDELICFISTYGTQYEYVLRDGTALYGSKNLSDKMITMLNNKGYVNSYDIPRVMSLVSVDLLNPTYVNRFDMMFTMTHYFLEDAHFVLRPITYEGTEQRITQADSCSVILIERK